MNKQKHIIIYSHGFGVQKDDLGLFTEIAEALPEVESILFDYFDIDDNKRELYICPPSSQSRKLSKIVSETRAQNPDAVIDLICHSQGTIIAALAKPDDIRKAILLSPPFDMSLEHSLARYRLKQDAIINLDGTSIIPSSSGLSRIIPSAYWSERIAIESFKEYNEFSKKTEIIALIANQDQLVPRVDLSELSSDIKVLGMDGNHNFENEARRPMIEVVRNLLII